MVSVLLRLAPEALAEGRLSGEATLVQTGDRALVRDADELIVFLSGARLSARESDETGGNDDRAG
jgi:hypothetical protein